MRIELIGFQVDATRELAANFQDAFTAYSRRQKEQALALSAPTGSGKTMIAAAFIEQVLFGGGGVPGDEAFVFLWLTDQPQLNEQTARKIRDASSIDPDRIVIIDESFTDDYLQPGRLYFLNTQKLGANSSLVMTGGARNCSLWEALNNTITAIRSTLCSSSTKPIAG